MLAFTHQKRGFSLVMFGGDLLHQLIGKPAVEPIDHRRVTAERPVTERIDLMKRKLHGTSPFY
ncbi:hypothetical protein FQZ97_1251880 [compost metagenome]